MLLGIDGFGRSESRASLRDFFEVDAKAVVVATLSTLARNDQLAPSIPQRAMDDLAVDPERDSPATA